MALSEKIEMFEFIKKTEKEQGPALVGIELTNKEDYDGLLKRFKEHRFEVIELNKEQTLFEYLV